MLGKVTYHVSLQLLCLQLADAITLGELQAKQPTQALGKLTNTFSYQDSVNNLTRSTEFYKFAHNPNLANATFELGSEPYLSCLGEKIEPGRYQRHDPNDNDQFEFGVQLVDHDLLSLQCQQSIYTTESAAAWCNWHLSHPDPKAIAHYWAAIASQAPGPDVKNKALPANWLLSGVTESYRALVESGKRTTIERNGVYFSMVDVGSSTQKLALDGKKGIESSSTQLRIMDSEKGSPLPLSLVNALSVRHRACSSAFSEVPVPQKAICARIYSRDDKLGYTFAFGLDKVAVQNIDCSKFDANVVEYVDVNLSVHDSLWNWFLNSVKYIVNRLSE